MIRQAHSYLAGASASAALIAAAVTTGVVLIFGSAVSHWSAIPGPPAPAGLQVGSPDSTALSSGGQPDLRAAAAAPHRTAPAVPAPSLDQDGGAPVLAATPSEPLVPEPTGTVRPAPPTTEPAGEGTQSPDPSSGGAQPAEPVTDSGSSGVVGSALRGVSDGLGQVTENLLGPSSLVGGTLAALLGG